MQVLYPSPLVFGGYRHYSVEKKPGTRNQAWPLLPKGKKCLRCPIPWIAKFPTFLRFFNIISFNRWAWSRLQSAYGWVASCSAAPCARGDDPGVRHCLLPHFPPSRPPVATTGVTQRRWRWDSSSLFLPPKCFKGSCRASLPTTVPSSMPAICVVSPPVYFSTE